MSDETRLSDAEIDAVFASHWTDADTLRQVRRIGDQAKLANRLSAAEAGLPAELNIYSMFDEASALGEHMDDVECWRHVAIRLRSHAIAIKAERDRVMHERNEHAERIFILTQFLEKANTWLTDPTGPCQIPRIELAARIEKFIKGCR